VFGAEGLVLGSLFSPGATEISDNPPLASAETRVTGEDVFRHSTFFVWWDTPGTVIAAIASMVIAIRGYGGLSRHDRRTHTARRVCCSAAVALNPCLSIYERSFVQVRTRTPLQRVTYCAEPSG